MAGAGGPGWKSERTPATSAADAVGKDASDLPRADEVLPLAEHLRPQEGAATQLLAEGTPSLAVGAFRGVEQRRRRGALLVHLAGDLLDGRRQSFERAGQAAPRELAARDLVPGETVQRVADRGDGRHAEGIPRGIQVALGDGHDLETLRTPRRRSSFPRSSSCR